MTVSLRKLIVWELESTERPGSTLASGPKGWWGTVVRGEGGKIMGLRKAGFDRVQNDFLGTWLELSSGW